MTVVEVLEIIGSKIRVKYLDALDGTPVLDIKPYEKVLARSYIPHFRLLISEFSASKYQ